MQALQKAERVGHGCPCSHQRRQSLQPMMRIVKMKVLPIRTTLESLAISEHKPAAIVRSTAWFAERDSRAAIVRFPNSHGSNWIRDFHVPTARYPWRLPRSAFLRRVPHQAELKMNGCRRPRLNLRQAAIEFCRMC